MADPKDCPPPPPPHSISTVFSPPKPPSVVDQPTIELLRLLGDPIATRAAATLALAEVFRDAARGLPPGEERVGIERAAVHLFAEAARLGQAVRG